ncbi:MAG TPA: hypothetical protein VEN29_22080 [Casimicrobiaceae bacterium]|nr:hypothetical protein [Casimicrobiaceae bacterium]
MKRLIVAFLFAMAASNATALEYTDVYLDVAEPGWGAFLVQSDTFQFIAFFIYDKNGNATWYTAQITDNGSGSYTGTLYAITGTYFANPWQGYGINPAGTATFTPTDIYHATLTYTVNGVGTITKTIQRQTLTPYLLAGDYSGSMAGSISGCTNNPASNDPAFRATYGLTVTTGGDATEATTRTATLVFTFVDTTHSGIVCTVTGPLTHFGRIYQMAGATTIACTGPGLNPNPRTATIDSLHPTGQGIEGKITGNVGGGCTASWHFAAVLNVNN